MAGDLAAIWRGTVPRPIREATWRLWSAGPRAMVREAAGAARLTAHLPIATIRVDGLRLRVDLRDSGVGWPLYVERTFGEAEARILRQRLGPGMIVADVGANIGVFSTLAGRLVGPTGRVLAVEPDPHNGVILRRNVEANGLLMVEPIAKALGSEAGTATLYRSASNFGDHRLYSAASGPRRQGVDVEVTTLDALMAERGLEAPDLIKIDVQGFEHGAMQGARRTLASDRLKTVMTEFWPHGIESAGGSASEYFRLLVDAGLSPAIVEADGAMSPVDYEEVMARIDRKMADGDVDGAFVNLAFTRD